MLTSLDLGRDDGATARRIDADREAYAAGTILVAFQKEKFPN
jgi:hypothetical protein